MDKLNQIETRLKIEIDKVYGLLKSPNPGIELQMIMTNVLHLMRLKDEEILRGNKQ